MQYDETHSYLLSLGHETLAIKLGLKNTELLLAALGNPQHSYPAVQIAGTNGKGSTAVVLDSICRAAGVKSGLFTSPHLVSITERIKVGAAEITQADFARLATVVRDTAQRLVDERSLAALPTFFEHITAIALLAFKEARIDLAILETGLGGRLDSTTVVRADTIAITPIALDHQEYLGETLALIAAEKAAIIRPGVTAIIAPQPPEALAVIHDQCEHCRVTPQIDDCVASVLTSTDDGRMQVTFETGRDRYEAVLLGLRGRHQIINVSLAIRLAESLRDRGFRIDRASIIRGIETANHPGRLELHDGPPRLLLDGAHNPAAARVLRDYLDEFVAGPITLVFGAMRDKNLDEMAAILFPAADQLILTQPDNPRAASVDQLAAAATGTIAPERITLEPSTANALRAAYIKTAANGIICVTGSLYLIGELQAAARLSQSTNRTEGPSQMSEKAKAAPVVLESKKVFDGRVFDVFVDTVREGEITYVREVVHHPGSAVIVPVFADGTVALVRQYRHPAERYLLEAPAGSLDQGESPATGAARELEEELGYIAGELDLLSEFYVSPGFCGEKMWVYLATDLTKTAQRLEEDELIEVVHLTLSQALAMITTGEIEDAKTIIGLMLAAPRVGSTMPDYPAV